MMKPIEASQVMDQVKYEIRGKLAWRAQELERQGHEVIHLNIGNPARFGLRTPETMRLAVIENLSRAEGYCHQKGIFPAREAVVMRQQERGIDDVSVDDVFIGNGVSELIDLTLRALLNDGDEVLLPSPDYPLWSAAVSLNRGQPVYYDCRADNDFMPDPEQIEALIGPRTRALVLINPNNPTGAVYDRATLHRLAELAERHQLLLLSDEIYDQVLFDEAEFVPMASLVRDTLCISFSGLSKVYRACGFRVGWMVVSGERRQAQAYLDALELLASLRLCSNVPGQWAVQTALGGLQSIQRLTRPGGQLYERRQAVVQACEASEFLDLFTPRGAMYAFPSVNRQQLPDFDDHEFALALLDRHHVLLVPGSSFNFPDRHHFRATFLPGPHQLARAFRSIHALLAEMAAETQPLAG